MKSKAQVRRLPVRTSGGKSGGKADLSEHNGAPQKKFVPTIDDPSVQKATSTVISSDAIEQRLGK